MNQIPTAANDFSPDEAILIEYLDGELDAQTRQIVEERLAKEPLLRNTLEQLESSWNYLDLLEKADGSKEVVKTTLEVVILQSEAEIKEQEKQHTVRFPKSVIAVLLTAVCFSFFLFHWGAENGDRNYWFRTAFPIIEKFDMYQMLQKSDPDLQLLHLLAKERIFLPEEHFEFDSKTGIEFKPEMVQHLDAQFYNKLFHSEKSFSQLPQSEKEALRELHERIVSSPQSGELFLTLYNYYQWFKMLPSYEKAELRQKKLSPELRCGKIATLKSKLEENQLVPYYNPSDYSSAAETFRTLSGSDASSMFRKYAEKLQQLDTRELNEVLDAAPEQLLEMLR
ncbi:MAG: hypothetical protein FWE67_00705 [Planctomycetaceae bacterium]|nr:hypothetical protein [Planctomycetaceae bacterium]